MDSGNALLKRVTQVRILYGTFKMYDKKINVAESLKGGYAWFFDKNHPLATKQGVVLFHRHVCSLKYGRWVLPHEVVHHKDENKLNNDPDNLEILTVAEHNKVHAKFKNSKFVCKRCSSEFRPRKAKNEYCNRCKLLNKAIKAVKKPTKEELSSLIKSTPMTKIAKIYGISDNAIRKWCRKFNIETRVGRGFWSNPNRT